jgi:hypothetical protein
LVSKLCSSIINKLNIKNVLITKNSNKLI